MKKILIPLCILIALSLGCKRVRHIPDEEIQKIHEKRAYTYKVDHLFKPTIIPLSEPVIGLVGINKKNSFVTMNEKMEFCLVKMEDDGYLDIDVVVDGFPGQYYAEYFSESESTIVWQRYKDYLNFLDIESKKTTKIKGNNELNDSIHQVFLVDVEKSKVLITSFKVGDEYWRKKNTYYILYDFNKNEIIFKSPLLSGVLFPYNKNKLLFEESTYVGSDEKRIVKWHIVDLHFKKREHNSLTREYK